MWLHRRGPDLAIVRWMRNLTAGRPRRPKVRLALSSRSGPPGVGPTSLQASHFLHSLFDSGAKGLPHNTSTTHWCGQRDSRRQETDRTRTLRHRPSRLLYFHMRTATFTQRRQRTFNAMPIRSDSACARHTSPQKHRVFSCGNESCNEQN